MCYARCICQRPGLIAACARAERMRALRGAGSLQQYQVYDKRRRYVKTRPVQSAGARRRAQRPLHYREYRRR